VTKAMVHVIHLGEEEPTLNDPADGGRGNLVDPSKLTRGQSLLHVLVEDDPIAIRLAPGSVRADVVEVGPYLGGRWPPAERAREVLSGDSGTGAEWGDDHGDSPFLG